MPLLKKNEVFDSIDLHEDLKPILSFLSEICELPYVFVSFLDSSGPVIKTEIGFNFLTIPQRILLLNHEVINQNKVIIVTDQEKKETIIHTNPSRFSYGFFAGFPICSEENKVVGTLCIMDDNKVTTLSSLQLKSVHYGIRQIQSLLKLYRKNKKMGRKVLELKNQFQVFIDNSNEIFYEVSMDGIITNASASWTRFLGHDLSEVIGKKNDAFIHPEDFERCSTVVASLRQGEQNEEEMIYRIAHQDGNYVWHSSKIKLVIRDGIQFYEGNCRDITVAITAQQKLLRQKEFYEKILDQLPTEVAVYDNNYKYTYLNPTAIKNDELRKFIIGKDDFEYAIRAGIDDLFAKKRREKFLEALATKNHIEWDDIMQHQNGETSHHTRKFAPVFDIDGSLEMMIGFGINTTERKKNQDEIFKSRKLTESILKNVAVGILVQGPQSEIIENNKAACIMLGFNDDQLKGKTFFDADWKVIHEDGSIFLPENHPVRQAIQKSKPVHHTVMGVYRPMFYDMVWLLVDAVPVFGDTGELLYVISSFNDITAQKKAEDNLKISNERFSYSSKATSDAIWDWNMVTDEIFIGESYSTLFGHQFENKIANAQAFENFIHPEDRHYYFESLDSCINSAICRWSAEYRYLKSDGFYAFVSDKAVIVRNDEGKAIRMIGAIQDITIEKRLKNKLQQSEAQFKGIFENSAVGMALVNTEGYYLEFNDRICQMFGYSGAEMISLKFQDITHNEDLTLDLDYKEKLDSGKIISFSLEKRFLHKDTSIVWAQMFVSISKNSNNEIKHYIVQVIDISKRKKIEEHNQILTDEINRNKALQLDKVKNMYRLLADNMVDLVCLHNLDSTFRYISPSIYKLLGYIPEELIGKLPEEFVHPDDVETLRNNISNTISGQEDIASQLRFRNKEDQFIWLESKVILVYENGIPESFQSGTRDISRRKEAEKIIEDTLVQERELNELRTNLVSTISHEFRTPMTTIRTSAELISMYLEGSNCVNLFEIEKRINVIVEEIDRIVELMNAVLIISKEESGKTDFNPVTFDLKQVCLDVIDSSYCNYDVQRKVQSSFEGDSFTMFADKNLIKYCIFNLLNNAFKYSKGTGDIIFRVVTSNDFIVIEIIDFGIGVPEKDQSKLFNTFFRASNVDGFQGTGLGLYIVKTFAEKNSGTVSLESQVGKGTKVTLKFPLIN